MATPWTEQYMIWLSLDIRTKTKVSSKNHVLFFPKSSTIIMHGCVVETGPDTKQLLYAARNSVGIRQTSKSSSSMQLSLHVEQVWKLFQRFTFFFIIVFGGPMILNVVLKNNPHLQCTTNL